MPDQNHFIYAAACHDSHFTIWESGTPPDPKFAPTSLRPRKYHHPNFGLPIASEKCMISFVTRIGASPCDRDCAAPLLMRLSCAQGCRRRRCSPPAVDRFTWLAAIWRCSKRRTFARKSTATLRHRKPALGFDLRYHAGFNVTVPLKELAGDQNSLTILFRVTPEGQAAEPAYFIQRYTVRQYCRGRRRRRAAARIARLGRRQLSRGLDDARPPPAGVLLLLGHGSCRCLRRIAT